MYRSFFKRTIDITASAGVLIVFSPVLITVAALLYFFNDGAGVFFLQERPGYKGRPFKIVKFKTMNERKGSDGKLLPDKQRITRFGAFVRNSSLDELPQLVNVLRGDMSNIGPRPHMVAHTEYYTPRVKNYMRRHEMRPGLTGYAQVNGFRGATPTVDDMRRRVEADIYYIDHYSLWLDLKIFFMTIWKMLTLKL